MYLYSSILSRMALKLPMYALDRLTQVQHLRMYVEAAESIMCIRQRSRAATVQLSTINARACARTDMQIIRTAVPAVCVRLAGGRCIGQRIQTTTRVIPHDQWQRQH